MPSKTGESQSACVWVWLPGSIDPVVAGQIAAEGNTLIFNYGQSYMQRIDAISLYTPSFRYRQVASHYCPDSRYPGVFAMARPTPGAVVCF